MIGRLIILKSATKPLNILIVFTRPLITEFADNVESNCSMIENNPQKGVSLSGLICIFAMSIVGFSFFAALR